MQTIEQKRTAALARIAAGAARAKHRKEMRDAGRFQALLAMAGMSMVRTGGAALRDLREDCYDAARAINGKANTSIEATYDTAMMGGEPYAAWN